jgi:lipopolysaccharide transport system ATP-binding protein
MSKEIILKAENISKQYRLGIVGTGTLSHDLNRWWHKICGKENPYLKVGETNDRTKKGDSDYVWALQDINFEVERGEILGIIGKNGAGKSTLLKILSKVTTPTTGSIKSRGRIASLLEVGTGFNPELTGRENIYLNGAILGMTKKEITEKLPEIIEFSGCERYIDTPTKRYSSGMTVRLAFAVAAFLEPEILVVDEVLAVGDAEFQKKAIGKMQDISKSGGRTVLFVSHNMAAVKSLCTKGIVMENGQVSFNGNCEDAILFYQSIGAESEETNWNGELLSTDGNLQLQEVKIAHSENPDIISFSNTMPLKLSFRYKLLENIKNSYRIVYTFLSGDEVTLFSHGVFIEPTVKGEYIASVQIPPMLFNRGNYRVLARVDVPRVHTQIFEKHFISFDIVDLEFHNYGVLGINEPKGYFHIDFEEDTIKVE